jgi:hypothetical protein
MATMRSAKATTPSARCQAKLAQDRHRLLPEFLGALGEGKINIGSFWRRMAETGLQDPDIDQYLLDEYPDGIWSPE